MRRLGILGHALVVAVVGLLCAVAPARAGFSGDVQSSATRIDGGLYLYTYVVSDAASSTASITEFDVTVKDPNVTGSITAPGNFFTFYSPTDSLLSFTAFDAGIAPGTSGTFSFVSSYEPGQVSESIQGFDSSASSPVSLAGMVTGAATVPEPSSLVMCALGAIGGFGLIARSARKRSV